MDKLLRHDDIIFYSDVMFFIDELSDRGHSSLNAKIRVMPECFLIMLRMFVRIDTKCVRLWQWRFYHEFGSPYIITDFEAREDTMAALVAKSRPVSASMHPEAVKDERFAAKADNVYESLLPIRSRRGLIKIMVD